MTDLAKEVTPVNIEDELRQSYLDYAMSVIVGRALPDAVSYTNLTLPTNRKVDELVGARQPKKTRTSKR